MINLLSRPMPGKREYLRGEAYLGRYVQSNLFALCWVERMLQVENDQNNRIYDWIKRKFFSKTLYDTVSLFPHNYK